MARQEAPKKKCNYFLIAIMQFIFSLIKVSLM